MARPKKSPAETQSEQVNFRLSPVELARLKDRADKAKTTVSDFARTASLNKPLKVQQTTAPDFMTRNELRRIGNNLNQSLVEFRMKKIDPPAELLGAISNLEKLFDRWLNHDPTSSPKRP